MNYKVTITLLVISIILLIFSIIDNTNIYVILALIFSIINFTLQLKNQIKK